MDTGGPRAAAIPRSSSAPAPVIAHRIRAIEWMSVLSLAAAALDYVCRSVHWPLMLDSPVMHYVVFLMQHGLKPYSQITDMNMPGAYLTEWFGMLAFGSSDLAWRVYEFALLALLTVAMCVVAGRRNRIAGLYAGGVFVVMHAAEGPRQAVERDEVIAVLMMLSYAALFASVRRQKPYLMFLIGVGSGLAASIKPTFLPFASILFSMAWIELRRRGVFTLQYLLAFLSGIAAVSALVLGFLLHYHAVGDLFFILHTVIPVYRGSSRTLFIAVRAIPKYLFPIVPFATAALIGNLRQGLRWNWERWTLAGGVLLGLISYFVQGKGIVYHRYEYLVCLLLLMGLEIFASLRGAAAWRWSGAAAVFITIACVVPIYLWNLHHVQGNSDFTLALENDLQELGGAAALQDKIQCLDLTTGCLNALYHLEIVENGGYSGDMLFFTAPSNPATEYYRNVYLQRAAEDPPTVLVLSNQDTTGSQGFNRIGNWPAFQTSLDQHFTEVASRSFPREGLIGSAPSIPAQEAPSYRIYVRNQSPLIKTATHLLK
jgi:hypothetical protein